MFIFCTDRNIDPNLVDKQIQFGSLQLSMDCQPCDLDLSLMRFWRCLLQSEHLLSVPEYVSDLLQGQ